MPAPTATAVPPLEVRPARHYEHPVFQVVIDALYGPAGSFVIWCNIGPFAGFEVRHKLLNLLLYLHFEAGRAKTTPCCFDGRNSGQLVAPASSGVFHLAVKDGIAIRAGLFHGFGFTRQNYLLFTNSHSY
jgi:hypothetical protein